MKKKRGISLIILIITIVVVLILLSVILLTLRKNNPVDSAYEARFKADLQTFQDELAMYISKDYIKKDGARFEKINASTYTKDGSSRSVYTYIRSFVKKYENKFVIENDELVGVDKNLNENEKNGQVQLIYIVHFHKSGKHI